MHAHILATQPRRENRLLTTTHVAGLLGLTVQGVRWLAHQHRIPCERTQAGQYVFRENDVERVVLQRAKARAGLVVLRPRPRVGSGEPRQLTLLPLLVVDRALRLVGKANELLSDRKAKGSELLREPPWVR